MLNAAQVDLHRYWIVVRYIAEHSSEVHSSSTRNNTWIPDGYSFLLLNFSLESVTSYFSIRRVRLDPTPNVPVMESKANNTSGHELNVNDRENLSNRVTPTLSRRLYVFNYSTCAYKKTYGTTQSTRWQCWLNLFWISLSRCANKPHVVFFGFSSVQH